MKEEVKIINISEFMKVANFFMLSSGLEFYNPKPVTKARKRKLLAVAFLMIGNLVICSISEIIQTVIMYMNDQFQDATSAVIYIEIVFIAYFKIFFLFRHKDNIQPLAQLCVDIFPHSAKNQRIYKVKKYLRQSTRYTITFSVLYMSVIWMINIMVLFKYFILDLWLNIKKVGLTLPYYPYVPWDYQHHWSYGVLYIAEAMAGYTTISITVASDLVLCAYIIQLVMHFDFLAHSITEYKLKSPKEDLEFLCSFVRYQKTLYGITDKCNEVFGIPMFFNFFASTFIICFCGLQISINTNGVDIFRFFGLMFANMLQVFLLCYYGQRLYDSVSTLIASI